MPCLILTGYPCSGKTTFAKLLSQKALSHPSKLIQKTIIINEESACCSTTTTTPSKRECYSTSHSEKLTRQALKSEFDKHVISSSSSAAPTTTTLVILDSMNYIKGYRYELYCIAKAANQRYGVIWIVCDWKVCQEWNQRSGGVYEEEMMDALVKRYEMPDERNRWDRPLYRVNMSASSSDEERLRRKPQAEDVLQSSVYNMHSPDKAFDSSSSLKNDQSTNHVDLEQTIDTILDSFFSSQPLKQSQSTINPIQTDSNVLHQVDTITQNITNAILEFQKNNNHHHHSVGQTFGVSTETTSKTIVLTRTLHLPEMRRLRRQYIKWLKQYPPEDTSLKGISDSFLSYLETQL